MKAFLNFVIPSFPLGTNSLNRGAAVSVPVQIIDLPPLSERCSAVVPAVVTL